LLGGFLVEPDEVVTVLRRHPAVGDAVVVGRAGAPSDKRLVAYVVPKVEDRGLKIEDSQADTPEMRSSILHPLSSDLRAFLEQRLPEYMIPTALVVLTALPLTPNGKVD